MLDFHNAVGGWRVCKSHHIKLPTDLFKCVRNEHTQIPVYERKEIEIEDEYNTDAIVEKIVDKKQVMIRGDSARNRQELYLQRDGRIRV